MIGVGYSIVCFNARVEATLTVGSVWEGGRVRGVADFHVEGLMWDRGR